jgi:hypothetical protein
MSLPLPGFAAQVKATSPKANLASLVHSAPVSTPPAIPCKKDRDPRLKSPTTPTSQQMFSLKSPPPSLKSPPGKPLTDKCPSIVVSPAAHDSGSAKPHDPRLGLLQLAMPSGPKSPPRLANNDMEDISDGEKEPAETVSLTLEERLRALDEKYEKWSGSTKQAVPTPIGASTPSATPTPVSTPSLPSSTPVLSSACPSTSSASSGSSAFKFNFDLKSSQPSAIVRQLLSRKSVFDEDSKRLENISEVYDVTSADGDVAKTKNVSVGSVNFGASYNSISVLTDKSAGSSPASPAAAFTSALPKDIPTMPPSDDCSIPPSPVYIAKTAASTSLPAALPPTPTAAASTPSHPASAAAQVPPPVLVAAPVPVKATLAGTTARTTSTTTASVSERPQMTAAVTVTPNTVSALCPAPPKTTPAPVPPAAPPAAPKSGAAPVAVVGQVKPVSSNHRSAPLPSVVGASTTTTPIKPLVDGKVRPLVSNKPSATVTPTFKTVNQSGSVVVSGSRKSASLSTTVATKTSCSATTAASTSAALAVEKGEASSTTSSPKTELVLACPPGTKVGPNKSQQVSIFSRIYDEQNFKVCISNL